MGGRVFGFLIATSPTVYCKRFCVIFAFFLGSFFFLLEEREKISGFIFEMEESKKIKEMRNGGESDVGGGVEC